MSDKGTFLINFIFSLIILSIPFFLLRNGGVFIMAQLVYLCVGLIIFLKEKDFSVKEYNKNFLYIYCAHILVIVGIIFSSGIVANTFNLSEWGLGLGFELLGIYYFLLGCILSIISWYFLIKKFLRESPVRSINEKTNKKSEWAIFSLFTAVNGIFSSWVLAFGLFFELLAIAFGFVALKKIKNTPMLKGRKMAISGIIIGFSYIIIILLWILISLPNLI